MDSQPMNNPQYDEYLKAFWEQKRLEEYQQQRVLVRPDTTKATVSFYFVLLFVLLGIAFVPFAFLSFSLTVRIAVFAICSVAVVEAYGRFLAIKMVECYQHYASEEKRRSCKCVPSCSEYAILCFKKYELVYALIKIRKRLFVTCKGFDYIVDHP